MPPHYTPDGSWFWTGTEWIPANQVLNPPPDPVLPPALSARPGSRRKRWRAAALAVLLVAFLTAGALAIRPGRHGGLAPLTPVVPPASAILAMPFTHNVHSAAIQGTLTRNFVRETVAGVIDFAPGRALHLLLSRGGSEVAESLDCAGIGYRLAQPGALWIASPRVSLVDSVLGWAGGPPPAGLRVAGRGVVAKEPAWHLESPSGAAWWIGAGTGHPLRFDYDSPTWKVTLTFDGFGTAPAMTVPPPGDVSTEAVQGATDAVVTAPGLAMELGLAYVSPGGLPAAAVGYRYEALYLSYQNLGPEPVKFDNLLTLTDAYGAQYQEASGIEMYPALPRYRSLAPGQVVTGWDVFLVARAAWALTLRVGPPPEQQNVDFLITITVS